MITTAKYKRHKRTEGLTSKLTVLIYPTRHDKLRRHAKRVKRTQNEIVDKALREYFARHKGW